MSESEKRDTLADIVAEIRAYGSKPPPRLMWLEIADRIEAEARRDEVVLGLSREEYKGMQEALAEHDSLCEMLSESRRPVGNAAAMREALEMARDALKSAEKYVYGDPPDGGAIGWDDVWPSEWHNVLEAVERALSAPPRQCDVGTAEEQSERMEKAVCSKHHGCVRCPLRKAKYSDCSLGWAQTPYEVEEGGAK